MSGSVINVCSPVFDMTTADVWRFYAATDWDVAEIYDQMHQANIAIENQRVGSLLNFAATKNISSIKTLEPDLYARINARFQNIEFMAQFGKSGYYKVGKPKDAAWNGRNHVKAGMEIQEIAVLAELYEKILQKYGINHVREEYEFTFPQDKKSLKLKSINPLEELIKSGDAKCSFESGVAENEYVGGIEGLIEDGFIPRSLRTIHTTWKDYCLYMLNTTAEPIRSIWREKMVTSILSWKYATGSTPDSTVDALDILSDLPPEFTQKVVDDVWTKSDYKVFGRLNISGKHILSISKYPQESLEKEALSCIEQICKDKDLDMLMSSPKFIELADLWNAQGGKSITPLDAQKNYFGKEEKVEYPEVHPIPEAGTDQYWKNVIAGAMVWFKENIHSTSSWKRFSIAILKNDVSLKYLSFGPSSSERLARANALAAFSDKQAEREKAKKDAEKMAAKMKKEMNE